MDILAVEQMGILGVISPVSQAPGAVSTGWVAAQNFDQLCALIQTGVLGASATVDAKLQQAQDNAGTGAKDVTGKAITQIIKASGDNVQALINLRPDNLDVNNGFNYVRLTITVGTAASLVGGMLCGFEPRLYAVTDIDAASVVQIVN